MPSSNVAAQPSSQPVGSQTAALSMEGPKRRTTVFRAVFLIICVLLGSALGAELLTFSKFLPNDLARIGVLLRALHTPGLNTSAVIFGDSVIMSGVDTRIVQARVHSAGPVLNLSSVGQTLAESSLYYQELPPSATTIVQAVPLATLVSARQKHAFNAHVANMFNLEGYRPNNETLRTLTAVFGEADMRPLVASHLATALDSRWLVQQYIDSSIKKTVRGDLTAERALHDLYYPQAFTRPLEHDKLVNELDFAASLAACSECSFRADFLALITSLQLTSARHERRLVILLPPVHPALQERYAEVHARLKQQIQAGLFGGPGNVIDAFQLLPAEDFFDSAHPTREGAEKLSNFIAEQLGRPH